MYPSTRWWETTAANQPAPDRAFKSVIAAIKQQDRPALLKLTDPTQARDTADFDRQASAFFRQLQAIQLLEVPRAYEFDGLVVYFGKFQSDTQTAFVPLAFAHEGTDVFGFLPSRSKQLTYTLVNEWFVPSFSAPAETPPYCADSDVQRATHRVSLAPSSWRPSSLLLTGAAAAVSAQVKATIDQMKGALRATDVGEVFKYLTPKGGDRLRQWFATASQPERDAYKTAFIEQEPFFVLDESPLLVVYTRTARGDVQVLYFTVAADRRLLWTNSSYLTISDTLFKRGPLFAAAGTRPPFSGLLIK